MALSIFQRDWKKLLSSLHQQTAHQHHFLYRILNVYYRFSKPFITSLSFLLYRHPHFSTPVIFHKYYKWKHFSKAESRQKIEIISQECVTWEPLVWWNGISVLRKKTSIVAFYPQWPYEKFYYNPFSISNELWVDKSNDRKTRVYLCKKWH